MFVDPATYSSLSHLSEVTRIVLAELLFRVWYEDEPQPFTMARMNRLIGWKMHVSPKDVFKKVELEAGVKIVVSMVDGRTVVKEFELGKWAGLRADQLESRTVLSERVHVATGNKFRKERVECDDTSKHSDRLSGLLGYLNEPRNIFAKVSSRAFELKDLAKKMLDAGELTHHGYLCQLSAAEAVLANPQPRYHEVSRTPRIYPTGSGALSLCKELRECLVKRVGWLSFDLKSAQLDIVAKVWDIPDVRTFLDSGDSVWTHLSGHMGFSDKVLFKESVYAIIFGSSIDRNTKNGLPVIWRKAGRSSELASFLAIPLISALVTARAKRLKKIQSDLHIVDAFGNERWLDVKRKVDALSLLACEAQSYETAMMLDVADAVLNHDRTDIALWIHDGIAVNCSLEPRKRDAMIRDAKGALGLWREKGFLPQLEVEFPECDEVRRTA